MDRNIDRQIAEKVMGWREGNLRHDFFPIIEEYWVNWADKGNQLKYLRYDWSPSSKVNQAFEVVEKVVERGLGFTLATTIISNTRLWSCEFWEEITTRIVGKAVAEKVPMAICRAVLAAVESKQ